MHAGDFEGNRLFAQQRHDPTDGADEARTVPGGPVHRLGEVDAEYDAGQRLGQDVDGAAAFDLPGEYVIFALGRGFDGEIFGTRCPASGEPGDGLRRARISRVRGRALRNRPGDRAILRRAGRDGAGWHRGARIRAGVRASRKAVARFSRAVGNHPIGDLFGADFEEEREAHWARLLLARTADPPRLARRPRPVCARAE